MVATPAIKATARRLLALSLDEQGAVSAERALEVIKVLEANPPKRGLRVLLKTYATYLESHLTKTQARIEHAGNLDAAALQELLTSLEQRYNRKLEPVVTENPALIAGVRARVGDDVFDNSFASTLQTLRQSLQ